MADDAAVVDRVEINGETVSTENKIVGEMAEAVRDGKINNIQFILNKNCNFKGNC